MNSNQPDTHLPRNAELIHSGRFSLVYKAEEGGRQYILKQLHPRLAGDTRAVEQFRKEASFRMDLPGIANVLEYKERDGGHYIIREYVDGVSLKEFIAKYSGRRWKRFRQHIATGICALAGSIHNAGVVHGDIKPSNILIRRPSLDPEAGPGLVLIDLGLAWQDTWRPEADPEHPLPFSMVYAAPELVLNFPGLVNAATDVYSCGLVIYELLSGRRPFDHVHPAMLLQLMIARELQPARELDKDVFGILRKASAKHLFKKPPGRFVPEELGRFLLAAQKERFQSAAELGIELEKAFFPEASSPGWFSRLLKKN